MPRYVVTLDSTTHDHLLARYSVTVPSDVDAETLAWRMLRLRRLTDWAGLSWNRWTVTLVPSDDSTRRLVVQGGYSAPHVDLVRSNDSGA